MLTVSSSKRGFVFFFQETHIIKSICCIKLLLVKCKPKQTSGIKNDTVDHLLLLGQETFQSQEKIPDTPSSHLLKHVEIEILLNSQLFTFHQELSLHIFWKNTKTDLNI